MILSFPIVSDKYIQLLIELSLTVKCMRPLESWRRAIAVFHFKFAGSMGLEPSHPTPPRANGIDILSLWYHSAAQFFCVGPPLKRSSPRSLKLPQPDPLLCCGVPRGTQAEAACFLLSWSNSYRCTDPCSGQQPQKSGNCRPA